MTGSQNEKISTRGLLTQYIINTAQKPKLSFKGVVHMNSLQKILCQTP